MPDAQPDQGRALVDNMQLAAYLVSHGLPLLEWRPKPNGHHWWAVFAWDDEYKRLRLAWPRSAEFLSFTVYSELLAQVKENEQTGNKERKVET